MQALEPKNSVTVSQEIHNIIVGLAQGDQTCGDVVADAVILKKRLDTNIPIIFKCLPYIGSYQFRKPMEFNVSYNSDDSLWDVKNEELSILGCGNTYGGILLSLEEDIDYYVYMYMLSNEKMSIESIELKKRLDEYIDFDNALKIYSAKNRDE